MHDRFEPLNSGEVVSIHNDTQVLSGHRTFRAEELSDAIKAQLASAIAGWSEEKNGWFSPEGIDCEALRFGANGWQKGRIRLCLEFCPDEATVTAARITSANISNPSASTLLSAPPASPSHHSDPAPQAQIHHNSSEHPIETAATINSGTEAIDNATTTIPGIGISMGAATVSAIATDAPAVALEQSATSEQQMPPIADAVLDEEYQLESRSSHPESFEEIAFDFDRTLDNRGTIGSSGMMELDLTDLGLDIADRDLLNFETHGSIDGSHEFINLQDIDDRPENSGMLIDEVWNEMSQPNWPGIK